MGRRSGRVENPGVSTRQPAFKGGQNIRVNVTCTALERPHAALVSPLRQAQHRLSSFAGAARPFGLSLRAKPEPVEGGRG